MPLSKVRHAAWMRDYRAIQKGIKAELARQVVKVLASKGLTTEDLMREWVNMATDVPAESVTWGAKAIALKEITAILVPEDDTSQQTTINIYGAMSDEEIAAKLQEIDAAFRAFVVTRPEFKGLVEGKVHQEEATC